MRRLAGVFTNDGRDEFRKMYPCTLCGFLVEVNEILDHYNSAHNQKLVQKYRLGDFNCEVCGDDVARDFTAILDHYEDNHIALLDRDDS